jgi:type I restriction enzyme S subunit
LVLHLDLNGIVWYKDIVPPMDLQEKFQSFSTNIEDKIQSNHKQNQELASLRDWLLPMLMNGQVTIKDANERVEEELGIVAEGKEEYNKILK